MYVHVRGYYLCMCQRVTRVATVLRAHMRSVVAVACTCTVLHHSRVGAVHKYQYFTWSENFKFLAKSGPLSPPIYEHIHICIIFKRHHAGVNYICINWQINIFFQWWAATCTCIHTADLCNFLHEHVSLLHVFVGQRLSRNELSFQTFGDSRPESLVS